MRSRTMPPETNTFRVLVVDDEPQHAEIFTAILKSEGVKADSAIGASSALSLLEQEQYSLVLTDLKMPGMDGMQLLAELRSRWPDLAVIMLTSYGDIRSAVKAMQQGALSYVTKGSDAKELMTEVRKVQKLRRLRARSGSEAQPSDSERASAQQIPPNNPGRGSTEKEGALTADPGDERTLRDVRLESEMLHIRNVLSQTGGNKTHAARILGITYRQLLNRLKD